MKPKKKPEENVGPKAQEASETPTHRMVTSPMIKVRARALIGGEPGGPYAPGAEFETTPDRVRAFGQLVERL